MRIKAKGGEGVDIYSGFHVPEEEANQGKYVPLHILCPHCWGMPVFMPERRQVNTGMYLYRFFRV